MKNPILNILVCCVILMVTGLSLRQLDAPAHYCYTQYVEAETGNLLGRQEE